MKLLIYETESELTTTLQRIAAATIAISAALAYRDACEELDFHEGSICQWDSDYDDTGYMRMADIPDGLDRIMVCLHDEVERKRKALFRVLKSTEGA